MSYSPTARGRDRASRTRYRDGPRRPPRRRCPVTRAPRGDRDTSYLFILFVVVIILSTMKNNPTNIIVVSFVKVTGISVDVTILYSYYYYYDYFSL